MRRHFASVAILLLTIVPQAYSDEETLRLTGEDWQVLEIDDQRIGYAHTEIRQKDVDGTPLLLISQKSEMKFQRFGKSIEIQTLLSTEETIDGDLLSYRFEIHNPPNQPTSQTGVVQGERLHLELTVNGRTTERDVAWTIGTKSPLYQERYFERNPPRREQEIVAFSVWQPELSKTGSIKLRTDTVREVKIHAGETARLLKVSVENSAIPTLKSTAYVDSSGQWIKTETDFFGKTLVALRVPADEALKELAGAELDLALATIIPVVGLRNPFLSNTITYRIKMKDDDPSRYFPSDSYQKVTKIDERTIELTVFEIKPPESTVVSRQTDDDYLKPTEFLQSDDRRVKDMARIAASGTSDPWRIATNMERRVFEKIKKKDFSTALASAAEVAESLEGDCTEHAMLLAAMLRAERIPSRVCIGFVYYAPVGGFAGHMWTEAWIRDRWVPLDATLAKKGVSRAHIKIADSSLGENAPAPITAFLPLLKLIGKVEIEVARQ